MERLLKSFDAQPRLAVVTKTIYNAWKVRKPTSGTEEATKRRM